MLRHGGTASESFSHCDIMYSLVDKSTETSLSNSGAMSALHSGDFNGLLLQAMWESTPTLMRQRHMQNVSQKEDWPHAPATAEHGFSMTVTEGPGLRFPSHPAPPDTKPEREQEEDGMFLVHHDFNPLFSPSSSHYSHRGPPRQHCHCRQVALLMHGGVI